LSRFEAENRIPIGSTHPHNERKPVMVLIRRRRRCGRACPLKALLSAMLLGLAAPGGPAQEVPVAAGRSAPAASAPVHFIENRGVYPDEVAFFVRGAERALFFTRRGVTFSLRNERHAWTVKLDFVESDPDAVTIRGEAPRPARISYFRGKRDAWRTGLRTFSRLTYRDVWPGIDLVYRGEVDRVKYAFVVRPGADPARIRLRYRGAERTVLTAAGALRVETPAGAVEDAAPVAYQDLEGRRVPVEVTWALDPSAGDGSSRVRFQCGSHDPSVALVIDPAVLVYCGFVGGRAQEVGRSIAVDGSGHAYITGATWSGPSSFPVQVGPLLTYQGGPWDAFVAKVKPDGSSLVYCGYLGGAGDDRGLGIAVDGAGNAYVCGKTESTEATFPVQVGPDLTYNGGAWDAFVAKISPTGSRLLYCGYVGGNRDESAEGLDVDAAGQVTVAGWTLSTESTFPVKQGPDLTFNGAAGGSGDAFVARIQAGGAALVYCGYVGGAEGDTAWDVALDAEGRAHVVGETSSDEQSFPVRIGPDRSFNGLAGVDRDAFVARVNPGGTGLEYCGYIGGDRLDLGFAIDVDRHGRAFVAGETWSPAERFPVRVGPDLTANGGPDAFVACVNSAGSGLDYCGYLGGLRADLARDVAVDSGGRLLVTGSTFSDHYSFPVTEGPDLTFNAPYLDSDAFVARVTAGGAGLDYCGYIGGDLPDDAFGVAVGPTGDAYVTGWTASDPTTFPVKGGPSVIHSGNFEVFVARVTATGLEGRGDFRPGGSVTLALSAPGDAFLPYQAASAFGTGPIPIDSRFLRLSPDPLLLLSSGNMAPTVFVDYRGRLDGQGRAAARLEIPPVRALIGVTVHTAFLTLSPSAPSGVSSISGPFSFRITP